MAANTGCSKYLAPSRRRCSRSEACIMAYVCAQPAWQCTKRQPTITAKPQTASVSVTSSAMLRPPFALHNNRVASPTLRGFVNSACHLPAGVAMRTHNTGGPSRCTIASCEARPRRVAFLPVRHKIGSFAFNVPDAAGMKVCAAIACTATTVSTQLMSELDIAHNARTLREAYRARQVLGISVCLQMKAHSQCTAKAFHRNMSCHASLDKTRVHACTRAFVASAQQEWLPISFPSKS